MLLFSTNLKLVCTVNFKVVLVHLNSSDFVWGKNIRCDGLWKGKIQFFENCR